MPKCEFSETQFSFCYTFEFIKKYCPWSIIPYFPSTYVEGQPGYGYDVKVDSHIYLQFKIPKYITMRRVQNAQQWDSFNQAYYRTKLNTDSEQHKLLNKLKEDSLFNEVCYVMPEFHDNNSISKHYISKNIVSNSAVFAIEDLPAYNSGHHNLCYVTGTNYAFMFSEPKRIPKRNLGERNLDNVKEANSLFQEAKRIRNILIENDLVFPQEYNIKTFESDTELANKVRNLLLSYFNILWLPIFSSRQDLCYNFQL